MTAYFHPSFAIREATGVEYIDRYDNPGSESYIYILYFIDGTTKSARLDHPDESNVLALIEAVKAASPSHA